MTPTTDSPPRRARRAIALVTAGGLMATLIGIGVVPRGDDVATVSDAGSSGRVWATTETASTTSAEPATDEESTGVVLVETRLGSGDGETGLGAGAGTGIVLTADGQVLTNYHVVESSADIRVTVASSGQTFDAQVVGASETADVALLQLEDASGLTTARVDDETLQLGDEVTAVGNAGGTGELTAADGRVTDLDSAITVSSGGEATRLTDLIETDADVESGESGGPLVDSEGEVVGVTTAASVGDEIDGYAVAIEDALAVVAQIRSGSETETVRIGPAAFLGVQLAPASGRFSDEAAGALIAGVTGGGAAAEAGLVAGDRVTAIGSIEISGASELRATIADLEPGERVELTWLTAGGSSRSATATLDASAVA